VLAAPRRTRTRLLATRAWAPSLPHAHAHAHARARSFGRPRTRLLRYRGSGSARSGDSEPPTRELFPDPTLNPACPRTTTCGSYLARDPARVAPLRVASASSFVRGKGPAAGRGVASVDRRITMCGAAISTTCRRLNHPAKQFMAEGERTSAGHGPPRHLGPRNPVRRGAQNRGSAVSVSAVSRREVTRS